ncbi:MAG TPA: response regulator [Polyangia bacterium]|jgi:DNA-binding NtrC family response regulator
MITALPPTVLVVDDEPQILKLLSLVLSARGLETLAATSGEEAVVMLKQRGIGCLIVDKNLPGIDGIAVLQAARREQPHCATIVMTGYSSTASAIEALRLGASDYLEKPFADIQLVAEKVDLAMKGRRAALERDLLSERIRGIQTELLAAGHKLSHAETEIDMFEQVFEFRLQEASAPLRLAVATVEARLRTVATSGALTRSVLMDAADELARALHARS